MIEKLQFSRAEKAVQLAASTQSTYSLDSNAIRSDSEATLLGQFASDGCLELPDDDSNSPLSVPVATPLIAVVLIDLMNLSGLFGARRIRISDHANSDSDSFAPAERVSFVLIGNCR